MEQTSKEERFLAFVRRAMLSGTTKDRRILVTTYRLHGSAQIICREMRRQVEGGMTPLVCGNVRELIYLWVSYEAASKLRQSRALHSILEVYPRLKPSEEEDMRLKLALLRSARRREASNVAGALDLQVIEGGKGGEKELFRGYRSSHVARHLTAVDWKTFAAVSPNELLLKGWQGKERHSAAPYLSRLADRFDQVSFWVATQILVPESQQLQVKALAIFIKIMKRLVDMHNHQTASQILAALNMAAVQRLKKVWAGLSFKLQEQFDEVDELFSPAGNYARYRELLRSLEARHTEPVLPYVAVFLRDVVYVFDGNADTTADGRELNLEKLDLLSQQLLRLKELQRIPFSFQLKRDLFAYVRDLKGSLDEEMLYSISLKRQPLAAGSASLQSLDAEALPSKEVTLEEIVSQPMLCNALRRFLTRRDVASSLAFYRDVARLDKASAGITRAAELYERYMASSAPLPVTLPQGISEQLRTALESKKQTESLAVLQLAQHMVADTLRKEHLEAFLQDSLYQESRVAQEKMRSTGKSAEPNSKILTSEDWANLFEKGKRTKVEAGGVLIHSGARCTHVFTLVHGKLQVLARDRATTPGGSKTVVTTVEKKGAIVGEMNVLDLGPSEVQVIGKARAELNRVRVADLVEKFLEEPQLGKRYYQFLGRRLAIVLGSAYTEVGKQRKRLLQRSPEALAAVLAKVNSLGYPHHTLRERFTCRLAAEPMCFTVLSFYRSFLHIRETRFGIHTNTRVKNTDIESAEFEKDSGTIRLKGPQLWILAFDKKEEASRAYTLLSNARSRTADSEDASESEAETSARITEHPLEMKPDDWKLLASNSDFVVSLGAEDAVMVQGETYRLVCLVLEGTCRVEAAGKEGVQRRTVATIQQGNVFGEMSFLTGEPATASVLAESSSRVCIVTYDKLDQLFETEPVLVLKLYHHLCKFIAFRIETIKTECSLYIEAQASRHPKGNRDSKRKDKRSKRH